jgi:hypothetical protein
LVVSPEPRRDRPSLTLPAAARGISLKMVTPRYKPRGLCAQLAQTLARPRQQMLDAFPRHMSFNCFHRPIKIPKFVIQKKPRFQKLFRRAQ